MTAKFLLGIAIVAFGSYCGYILSGKYRKRKLFFVQLKEFNERFLSEVSYYRRPLREFCSQYDYKGEFQNFLAKYFEEIDEISHSEKNIDFSGCEFLAQEDKNVISDYLKMLGKGDSSSQKAYFSASKDRLSKLCLEAEQAYKKYGDLYVKLGFLCGLLLLILMI